MRVNSWTPEQDAVLREGAANRWTDEEIRQRLAPLRPSATTASIAQRRWLLKLPKPRGGNHRKTARPSGDQKHCLGCGKPFRHPTNRLCGRCKEKQRRVAA